MGFKHLFGPGKANSEPGSAGCHGMKMTWRKRCQLACACLGRRLLDSRVLGSSSGRQRGLAGLGFRAASGPWPWATLGPNWHTGAVSVFPAFGWRGWRHSPKDPVRTSYSPSRVTKLCLPKPAPRQKMVAMFLSTSGLSGRGLGGEELFLVPGRTPGFEDARPSLGEIALRLGVPTAGLTLLRNGRALGSMMLFSDLQELFQKPCCEWTWTATPCFPSFAMKLRPTEVSLGEGSLSLDVKFDELPEIVQAICEPRRVYNRRSGRAWRPPLELWQGGCPCI